MPTTDPAPPPTFRALLRARLAAADMTQDRAAEYTRLAPSTFRSRLLRNNFSRREVAPLLHALNWEPPAGCDSGGRWTEDAVVTSDLSLAALMREVDSHRQRLDKEMDKLAYRLVDLIGAMRGGDLSISASATVTPLEFEREASPELTEVIARAVLAGATFVYIRPTAGYLETLFADYQFDAVPRPEDIRNEVLWFRDRLADYLGRKHTVSPPKARRLVTDHIIQVTQEKSPFWAAGFSMGMFYTRDRQNRVLQRMTVRLPGPAKRALLQPVYDKFASRFTTFVIKSLREAVAAATRKRKGKESAPDPAATPAARITEVLNLIEQGGVFT